jgi:hypothetical protein
VVREIIKKHYVDQLDAIALFAAARDEDLNQKTINKRVVVMLQAMPRFSFALSALISQ